MFYLILYIALIPAFAAFYKSASEDFYHSTAKYERAILRDGGRLKNDLTLAIREQFITANNGSTKKFEKWVVDIQEFRITKATFEEGSLHFQAYMRFASDDGVEIGGPRLFSIDANPSFVVGFPYDIDRKVVKIPESDEKSHWPVDLRDLFQGQALGLVTTERGAIILPMELQDRITALKNSFDGFPARSTGTYGRLLYFSAVTQTTLGFGDIVPISSKTRSIVGIQSVLGIVLIGLFLNSLAQLASRRS